MSDPYHKLYDHAASATSAAPRPDCACGHKAADHHHLHHRHAGGGAPLGRCWCFLPDGSCPCPAYSAAAPTATVPTRLDPGEALVASFAGSLVGGFLGAAAGLAPRPEERELDALRDLFRAARALLTRTDARARRDSGVPRAWLDPVRLAVDRLEQLDHKKTQSDPRGDGPRPVTPRKAVETKRR